jgi:hypothetical protein
MEPSVRLICIYETSLSAHKYISFKAADLEATRVTYHDCKTANLELNQKDLKANLETNMCNRPSSRPVTILYSQGGLFANDSSLVEQ